MECAEPGFRPGSVRGRMGKIGSGGAAAVGGQIHDGSRKNPDSDSVPGCGTGKAALYKRRIEK